MMILETSTSITIIIGIVVIIFTIIIIFLFFFFFIIITIIIFFFIFILLSILLLHLLLLLLIIIIAINVFNALHTCPQCVASEQRCDGVTQCYDQSDETNCHLTEPSSLYTTQPPSHMMVAMDTDGKLTFREIPPSAAHGSQSSTCPDTHFHCHLDGYYCLPVYFRCNGILDCPQGEDEVDCRQDGCPGFYQCRRSAVCLHPHHLCDGLLQCPQHDDEMLCGVACPDACRCYGFEFECESWFSMEQYTDLRYLRLDGAQIVISNLSLNVMLIHLRLTRCRLTRLEGVQLPNLRHLDLSSNRIVALFPSDLRALPQLRTLRLSGNPLMSIMRHGAGRTSLPSLRELDLSSTALTSLNGSVFKTMGATGITKLNLSFSSVQEIKGDGFRALRELRDLDLRGCPVYRFSPDLFRGLHHMRMVLTDNYMLCCPAVLPEHFNEEGMTCLAPRDEVSSCHSLLRANFYRMFLFIFALLALICNGVSFVYRVCVRRRERRRAGSDRSCDVLVSHLCVSDCLMGVYLLIIGVADAVSLARTRWQSDMLASRRGCGFGPWGCRT